MLSISRSGDDDIGGERISVILGVGCYWVQVCSQSVHPSMHTYVFICAFVREQCHAKMLYTHIRTYSNALDCSDCRVPRSIPCSLLLTHTACGFLSWALTAITVRKELLQSASLSCSSQHNWAALKTTTDSQQLSYLKQQHTQSFFLSPVDTDTSIHLNSFSRANTHTDTHRQTCVYVHKTSTIWS